MAFFRRRNWGMPLLGIWLILYGLFQLLSVNFPMKEMILPLLAVAAGVLILLDR